MILVDRPVWTGRDDTRFAHLVSDTSFAQLHAFVGTLATPRPLRFHRDHYDVPAAWWQTAVDAGARVVTTHEVVTRLRAGGLRAPRPREPAAESTRYTRDSADASHKRSTSAGGPASTTYSTLRVCETRPTFLPVGSWIPISAPT
jgi:Protein of unknown function (DUF4031)